MLALRLRELSFLNKGVTITLTDERESPAKAETFHAKGGLREMVQFLNHNRKPLHPEIIYIETERDDIGIELAMQYNDGVQRDRVLVRQQHQHARGRHAPDGLQGRADAHDQRVRGQGRISSRRTTSRSPAKTSARGWRPCCP